MDIDIDLHSDFDAVKTFPNAVIASRVHQNELIKHNVGAYFQNIAKDSVTQLSAIPYEQAENLGYFKVDFLHLTALDLFETKEEVRVLAHAEPDWQLLLSPVYVKKLFHLKNHFDVVELITPKSVQEVADCLAIIRPGKRQLLAPYLKDRNAIRQELYRKTEDGYYFKKSHAIAYATTIVLQLHLIKAGAL